MKWVIRLIGLASGGPSEHDGQFVVDYAPGVVSGNAIVGGRFITSPDRKRAKRFASQTEAYELWVAQNGRRPDGKPNRPLTAFHVEIEPE